MASEAGGGQVAPTSVDPAPVDLGSVDPASVDFALADPAPIHATAVDPAPATAPCGPFAPVDARMDWVDAARGIGILAVVVGHVWMRGAPHHLAYAFHMPFFFLLSGWLCVRARPPLAFARRQVAQQMPGYVAYLLMVLAADLLIEGARGHRPIFHHWPQDIVPLMLGGTWLGGPFTVFWFVPCLVVARIVQNALLARWPDMLSRPWLGIALASLALGYGAGMVTGSSPLGLLTVPMALFLLWAGGAWRAAGWRRWQLVLLVPAAAASFLLFPAVNMKAADYGWPVASVAGAVAIAFLLMRAARLPVLDVAPLRLLGRASLVIMYLHVPVIHYLTPYAGRPVLAVLATLLPLGAWWLFGRTRFTRRLLLAQG